MRRTKSHRQALERALTAFPNVQRCEIAKRPVRELAFVMDLLRRTHADRSTVQERVRWYGRIPARGLAGWEEEALEWGRINIGEAN